MTRQQNLQRGHQGQEETVGSVSGRPDPLSALPKTFEARGVRTPFTTRPLRFARVVRDPYNKLVINLPGLSGGLGTYEMPLETMRQIFDLSVHDRMLFEDLAPVSKPTPEILRRISRNIARTGVGGIRLAREADQLDAQEKIKRDTGQLTLVYQALCKLGGDDVQDMKITDLATLEGQKRARAALDQFARNAGAANQSVIDSLEQWSILTSPVGLATEGCAGPLRDLVNGLRRLSSELEEWSLSEMSNIRFMATHVVNGAGATYDHAVRWLRAIDRWSNDIGAVLVDWPKAQREIDRSIDRLWWLLDGWEELIARWRAATLVNRTEQRDALEELASFLPVIPIGELEPEEYKFWTDIRVNQVMWAAEVRKLGSGDMDADMVNRLERFREASE
ncbi:hypothetical protein [Thalassospira sp. MCCC 1A01428]|uniref:hypothetical protein n=1 Tax=Thalassospira sp. MCCC 1A01428 TaxID=1470575 RepID=UPI000A1F6004|nr:hypothetical protein [Thalassospira sp. MCCC 1A01428]OSQ46435.1 hypothetical protein THS27_01055 [Thalassospira sp. MCCC 1A01428]